MISLQSFKVSGLHGDKIISVPIRDNRLVIVGMNGLGKSTFLNILYYFISRQWAKLAEYTFDYLEATFEERKVRLTKSDLSPLESSPLTNEPTVNINALPSRLRLAIQRMRRDPSFHERMQRNAPEAARYYGLGLHEISAVLPYISMNWIESLSESAREVYEFLSHAFTSQIVYLPTYRRIEKDLDAILPGLEDELRRYHDTRRRLRAEPNLGFIELIEFGMEDVERSILFKLSELKDGARAELNSLAGSYLRDVLRGEGNSYNAHEVASLTDKDVEDILGRVEERTLDDADKDQLRAVINNVRKNSQLSQSQEYVAHFFVKLLSARQKLREREIPITRFTEVCNTYLHGKSLSYNDTDYSLSIISENSKRRDIALSSLSSGEKQIVSLFSQVYIGSAPSYAIIIDEPELSLSVPWQESLLPDLIDSGRCDFVLAVTHSPFIFNNEFQQYTIDISDYITEM